MGVILIILQIKKGPLLYIFILETQALNIIIFLLSLVQKHNRPSVLLATCS